MSANWQVEKWRMALRVAGLLTGACWLGGILPGAAAEPSGGRRPNFVLLIGEGQGWSSLSIPIDPDEPRSANGINRTPNLDRLAREGMRFTRFHAASPRCTPSRAALFTGKSPAQLHMTFIGEGRGDTGMVSGTRLLPPQATTELPASETTLAELLKSAGYRTAHFGKWHVGRADPARHGFDESTGPTSNGGPENVDHPNPKQAYASAERGMDFIRRSVAAREPFYLQIAQYAGKSALDARPETVEAVRMRMGNRALANLGMAAVAEDADTTYGLLLRQLELSGVLQNTFVIYTSDHGTPGRNPPLNGGKGTVGDGGLRVPLLVRGPGVPPGSVARQLVTAVDLFPTVAELAGVACSATNGLEGGSLAEVLRSGGAGLVRRPRAEFVVHFPHYDKDPLGPASALYLGDLKLVRLYETDRRQLYDVSRDPAERTDLASGRASKVAELDQRLTRYLADVQAQMPSQNPVADPAQAAETLPGDRRGRRGGRGSQRGTGREPGARGGPAPIEKGEP